MKRFFKKKKTFTRPDTNLLFIIPTCFFILGTFSILFGVTEAKFLDTDKDAFIIQAGTWWDGSHLTISDQSSQEKDACSSHELYFQITNNGYSMLDATTYKLYYSPENKSNLSENKVEEGTISPISENDQKTLKLTVSEDGFYQLKVEQRPFFQGNEDHTSTTSSNIITIYCEEETEEEEESPETNENQKTSTTPTDDSTNEQGDQDSLENRPEEEMQDNEETEQTSSNETTKENKADKKEEKSDQTGEKTDSASNDENEIEPDTNQSKEGMKDEIENGEREVKENNNDEKS